MASRSPSSPPPKRKALSLSLKKTSRFPSPTAADERRKVCQGYVPKSAERSTNWAVRVFEIWRKERNKKSDEPCPEDLFDQPSTSSHNKWLSAFVVEVCRENSERYPTTTITNILSGLWRYARSWCRDCPNFMDRRDRNLDDLNGALKNVLQKLRVDGVGAVVKHAAVVTPKEEDLLWTSGVIGTNSPLTLQRAIFYYVGKVFCLCGGEKQRSLKVSQFK